MVVGLEGVHCTYVRMYVSDKEGGFRIISFIGVNSMVKLFHMVDDCRGLLGRLWSLPMLIYLRTDLKRWLKSSLVRTS